MKIYKKLVNQCPKVKMKEKYLLNRNQSFRGPSVYFFRVEMSDLPNLDPLTNIIRSRTCKPF